MESFNMNICTRLVNKKLKFHLVALTFITLAYLLLVFYLTICHQPMQEQIATSYILGPDGLYKPDDHRFVSSHLHQINSTCSEHRNFVFIKSMKCATSTLLGMFYRFGYMRNLSFVSPLQNFLYLNWPFPMTDHDFRPSSRGYNILTDHAIYTENLMDAIMPNDTIYLSIIREPFAHLKSTFQYFKLAKIAGISENVTNPVIEYFSHLEKYESVYTAHGAASRWCIPDNFSLTKNIMSHCHGMPLGFPLGTENISADSVAIERYLQHLDSKFSLIMIVEYFHESLILLRRLMCWTFKDIVFINANSAEYNFKYTTVPQYILDIHRQWSSVDYKLYHYFNETFWKRISHQSSDFYSEVETFRLVEAQVQNYCQQLYKNFQRKQYPVNMTGTVIKESAWNDKFSISSEDCWMLGPDPYYLQHIVQRENDLKEAHLLAELKKMPDKRTMKGLC